MTDPTRLPPRLRAVEATSFPSATASEVHARALQLSAKEVDELLKAADALQDRINTVRNTKLAPPGVLDLAEKFQRPLIAFSNNVASLMERAK